MLGLSTVFNNTCGSFPAAVKVSMQLMVPASERLVVDEMLAGIGIGIEVLLDLRKYMEA